MFWFHSTKNVFLLVYVVGPKAVQIACVAFVDKKDREYCTQRVIAHAVIFFALILLNHFAPSEYQPNMFCFCSKTPKMKYLPSLKFECWLKEQKWNAVNISLYTGKMSYV